jgi:hypothetical protein
MAFIMDPRRIVLVILRKGKSWRFWVANLALLGLALALSYVGRHMTPSHSVAFLFVGIIVVYVIIFAFTWLDGQLWQVIVVVVLGLLGLASSYNWSGKQYLPDHDGAKQIAPKK